MFLNEMSEIHSSINNHSTNDYAPSGKLHTALQNSYFPLETSPPKWLSKNTRRLLPHEL